MSVEIPDEFCERRVATLLVRTSRIKCQETSSVFTALLFANGIRVILNPQNIIQHYFTLQENQIMNPHAIFQRAHRDGILQHAFIFPKL